MNRRLSPLWAGILLSAMALPVAAQAPAKSLGGGSGSGPVMSRDELRACLKQKDELARRTAAFDAQRKALDVEKASIVTETDALKATRAKHAESERAWCELATARGEKLAALATAGSTWQEWGGHGDTCEFVRQRAANTILDTALFADYCDCGWHATREALAAAKVQP